MSVVSDVGQVPGYMAQLLEELGWNQGTRIPLASATNQALETLLIERQNEIQRLTEAILLQKQKRADLEKYKEYVHTEYQENTRLLFAHKQQMEQEVKIKQLACNEYTRLSRDITDCNKQTQDVSQRVERLQNNIAVRLKKADTLKSEVCGERVALQEWRAALERKSCDIMAIEQFTKQDTSKAKELDYVLKKLKAEHDKVHDRLIDLVGNLAAEEKACERISNQVSEGMEQRKQMMAMWTGAIENLRQRDTEIRHIREDYAVLEEESGKLAEKCREQQAFCEQQRGNNAEARRENTALMQKISNTRLALQQICEQNVLYDSEVKSLQREVSKMRSMLESLHIENRQIIETQHRKEMESKAASEKLKELKHSLIESQDKSKSSEARGRQLEEMLNEEERYANAIASNMQRSMHCSFVEQQKLLQLKNEEKLFFMNLKSSKAVMAKLDSRQRQVEKHLQNQKESLYTLTYQLETIGSKLAQLEAAQAERSSSSELEQQETRLRGVLARHVGRAGLLERHSARLHDDMRRLARDIEELAVDHTTLQSRLKSSMLMVEGGQKELQSSKEQCRRERVEEALLSVRVCHASRAVAGLERVCLSLDKQRLKLEAAMQERMIEIGVRRDMFLVQKRSLLHDSGKLKLEIAERENRIEQLKKRYDIFIGSLGKDEYGQQMSATFFKIKFAAERAELRERGLWLDKDIGRCERDVSALEATLRVMSAAHKHFMHLINPLADDTPEIQELNQLHSKYYELRDHHKELAARQADLQATVDHVSDKCARVLDKHKQLTAREAEAENEADAARDRVSRNEGRLQNARDLVRHYARRAKKLIDDDDQWRQFQVALWVRDYDESAYNALQQLTSLSAGAPDLSSRFSQLVSATDVEKHLTRNQRRLHSFIRRIIDTATLSTAKSESRIVGESVLSSSSESTVSGASIATGYTRRVCAFRRELAPKIQEPALCTGVKESIRRSTMSLKVVSLGMVSDENQPKQITNIRRKSSYR